MNRTERAIKRQYREAEIESKKLKQTAVFRMKNSADISLYPKKSYASDMVKNALQREKECKKDTINYKCRTKKSAKEKTRA